MAHNKEIFLLSFTRSWWTENTMHTRRYLQICSRLLILNTTTAALKFRLRLSLQRIINNRIPALVENYVLCPQTFLSCLQWQCRFSICSEDWIQVLLRLPYAGWKTANNMNLQSGTNVYTIINVHNYPVIQWHLKCPQNDATLTIKQTWHDCFSEWVKSTLRKLNWNIK